MSPGHDISTPEPVATRPHGVMPLNTSVHTDLPHTSWPAHTLTGVHNIYETGVQCRAHLRAIISPGCNMPSPWG